jgi:hypothetical protein
MSKSNMLKLPLISTFLLFSNCLLASTYDFTLGGWSDGGVLSGRYETSFSAELDLFITTPEVINFEATYTGLHTFDWTLDDLVYFGYSSPVDLGFQLGTALDTGGPYIGSPFSFTLNRYVAYFNNIEFSHTDENMVINEIAPVPLPPSIVLILSGLIGLGGISHASTRRG